MKLFQRILSLCIFDVLFVTGEEMFLLTLNGKLYWYNTQNKETKQIAEKAKYMACDYQRKWLYYTSSRMGGFTAIVRVRMDPDGGDMKIITEKDKDDHNAGCIGVDQETGNVYYASTKGLVFLSYKQNYTKKIISTYLTREDIFDIGFHGKGPNKRVYWSTLDNLYTSQADNPQLTRLRTSCMLFSILDNGIVCGDVYLFLAKLNGVRTESLPNISIKSSKLKEIDCSPDDITAFDGKMYFVCTLPNWVLQMNLKTNTYKVVVPAHKRGDLWASVLPLPDQKTILSHDKLGIRTPKAQDEWASIRPLSDQKVEFPGQSVSILPVSTILMVVITVIIVIVLIVILAVTIVKYKKKNDSMPRRSDNRPVGEPEESQPSSTRECNVYTTMPSTE